MVNSELFRKVADKIENQPELYCQAHIDDYTECGTAHCIAGWAHFLTYGDTYAGLDKADYRPEDSRHILSAQELLGIDNLSLKLFHPQWKPREGLTVPQALRMIADGATVSEVSA
jgi:hypothetical protein